MEKNGKKKEKKEYIIIIMIKKQQFLDFFLLLYMFKLIDVNLKKNSFGNKNKIREAKKKNLKKKKNEMK